MPVPADETPYQRFKRLFSRYRFLFECQEGRCFYCWRMMAPPDPHDFSTRLPPDRVTIEHLITVSERRRIRRRIREEFADVLPINRPIVLRNARENLAVACHACNDERPSTMSWQDFMAAKIAERWGAA